MTLPIQHDRLAQLVMKTDPTLGLDAARIQLERACIAISASDAAAMPWGQAALLTIAKCGVRSFRGGVYLQGEFDAPVCVGNWMPVPLRRMLLAARCRPEDPPAHAIQIHVGVRRPTSSAKLYCWADGWVAAVGPTSPPQEILQGNELSGALSGSMAVTEAFRMTALGDLLAGKRTQRLSPLTPQMPDSSGIELTLLPSAMWVLGLGNLGQALLWVLGLLPYADPFAVHLVLQDMDCCAPENQDTQILTEPQWLGRKKARAAAEWAEACGFQTVVSELPFCQKTMREPSQPGLALVGVDNVETRRFAARNDAGFDLVLDGGLGATVPEIFDIRLHGFPGSREPSQAWPAISSAVGEAPEFGPALAKLITQGRLDHCGALSIAGQSVGIPSTAIAAATIQIAQACRAICDARFCDFVDVSLSNTSRSVATEIAFNGARNLLFDEARHGS